MAVIFFGTPLFAVPPLQSLIRDGEDIALVVTQPDRAKGRGHQFAAPPVKELALSHNLPVLQPERIRDEDFIGKIRALTPELIVVVAYGKLLPEAILNLPKRGCINIHGSLLPKYRGAAPIQWALIKGERTTGVTTMLMDKGLDTGPILAQAELPIADDDTTATLSVKLSELGAETLSRTLDGLRKDLIRPVPQGEGATYAPPLRKEDGVMDWRKSAEELSCFVRGMSPWPSAFTTLDGQRIKVTKVRSVEGRGEPGRIEKASGGMLLVGTGNGFLRIEELQPEGKRAMDAASFLAGRRLTEGSSFA